MAIFNSEMLVRQRVFSWLPSGVIKRVKAKKKTNEIWRFEAGKIIEKHQLDFQMPRDILGISHSQTEPNIISSCLLMCIYIYTVGDWKLEYGFFL